VLQIGSYRAAGMKPVCGMKGPFNVELRVQTGRQKLQYQIEDLPAGKYRIDIRFETICRLSVGTTTIQPKGKEKEPGVPLLELELTEPPVFWTEKLGCKFQKSEDFTGGQATHHRLHTLLFHSKPETVYQIVSTLLADAPHIQESTEPLSDSTFTPDVPICANDETNVALVRCEDCKENYCRECDDVLHRNSKKKNHIRRPLTGPDSKKRKNVGKCRCGSGAIKDIANVCITKRCPCFSDGYGCINCGCKSCKNPNGARKEKNASKKSKLSLVAAAAAAVSDHQQISTTNTTDSTEVPEDEEITQEKIAAMAAALEQAQSVFPNDPTLTNNPHIEASGSDSELSEIRESVL
jgi:hypothetical protein